MDCSLKTMENPSSRKIVPFSVFILFSLLIVGAFLFYAPSWGLMDDSGMLERAKIVWSGGDFFGNLTQLIVGDFHWGMFRPVFWSWAMLAYHIFRNAPLLIYLSIVIFNLITLLLWGLILHKTWQSVKNDFYYNIFLYPLSFFLFTPFWNNFMYISPQTKFIIFFSGLAIYLFYMGYAKEKKIYFVLSTVAILLSVLSHPEGVFLNLAMLLLCPVLFLLARKRTCIFNFILNLILFILYFIFTVTVQLKGSYTSKYGSSLNFHALALNLTAAPSLIKMLTLLSVFYFIVLAVIILRRENKFSPVFLIFPLGLVCFIAVLAPWGFPNYHLSVLTPFVMGMLFPVYSILNSKSPKIKILINSLMLVLVLLVLFFICFLRISKMRDIKKTEQFIVGLERQSKGNVYFMAAPCMEACGALNYFTNAQTVYLNDSVLTAGKLNEPGGNLMIFRDECPQVDLEGVKESQEVYKNRTWRIFSLAREKGSAKRLKVDFQENAIEKIKSFLKK
ncbi:hypothetical protein EPN54_05220 [bacterium]|nr:MAG: hypothetical protein EPN54_05220 [bacterium]